MNQSPKKIISIKNPTVISPKSTFNSIYVTSTKESPYHEDPFFIRPPPPLTAAKKKSKTQPIIFHQSRYNRSPRKFSSTTNFNKDYKYQTQLLNKARQMHNGDAKYSYQQKMKLGSPYRYDLSIGYEKSKIRTQQMLNDRYNDEIQKQKNINKHSEDAIKESYNHDLFFQDNIYSTHNKSLRIIPVTNRLNSLYPVSESGFI